MTYAIICNGILYILYHGSSLLISITSEWEKKYDLSDFSHGMVVEAIGAGLRISESAGNFSHTTISGVYIE